MSQPKPQICCPNPQCSAPLNRMGAKVCKACGTVLIYRYLWAVGQDAAQVEVGSLLGGRYCVTAKQIWLDTQPSLPPDVPTEWSEAVVPYLHLYPQRLHIPEVYGFYIQPDHPPHEIFLLENVPLDDMGILAPAIASVWPQATAVRQVYWLWQLWQLWTPLLEQGVAASLLDPTNIRVEGWRVRLCQLYEDHDVLPDEAEANLSLADLANCWLSWMEGSKPEVQQRLNTICQQMQAQLEQRDAIAAQLNQLLLEQAAQLPLRLHIVGATSTGPERSHNEDACYPLAADLLAQPGSTLPQIAIVCDGIGGHEGGEVASQLTVQTLKLETQALLAEVAQSELASPSVLYQQLQTTLRVANNLLANQNNLQGREDRRRMGTTAVMAVQVPQSIQVADGSVLDNGHELYLVNVGDSRAYWITPRYCQCLTVDDDVATREVKMGRALYREALYRPDAGALTQAIGTRDADFLHPTIQRFILEEDGLLMLCSDGVSDNELVEQTWKDMAVAVFDGQQSLDATVQEWLQLANQHNGYDNATMVLLRCHVSSLFPPLSLPNTSGRRLEVERSPAPVEESSDDTPATDASEPVAASVKPRRKRMLVLGLGVLLLVGAIALTTWSQLSPLSFQQFRERIVPARKP